MLNLWLIFKIAIKMMRGRNTLAVILDGSSEKGKLAAKKLMEDYDKVLLVGKDREKLRQSVEEISGQFSPKNVYFIQADLTVKFQLPKFIDLVKHKFGGADCVADFMDIQDPIKKKELALALEQFHNYAVNELALYILCIYMDNLLSF